MDFEKIITTNITVLLKVSPRVDIWIICNLSEFPVGMFTTREGSLFGKMLFLSGALRFEPPIFDPLALAS